MLHTLTNTYMHKFVRAYTCSRYLHTFKYPIDFLKQNLILKGFPLLRIIAEIIETEK